MGSLPAAKMSVGSAINDTTRVAGGALGVAVLGSLLASGYRGDMDSVVSGLPAPAREAAQDSLAGALRRSATTGWPPPRRTRSCPACTRRRWSRPRSRWPARSWRSCSCRAASGRRRARSFRRERPRSDAESDRRWRRRRDGRRSPVSVTARPPGRPRSAEADQAILHAALELLAESGYAALTMERVRERAGVGKATLYRRYGSKEELARAAIVHLNSDIPLPDDTGSLAGRLRGHRAGRPRRRRAHRRADADAAAAVGGRRRPGHARAVLRAPRRAAAAGRARDRRARARRAARCAPTSTRSSPST